MLYLAAVLCLMSVLAFILRSSLVSWTGCGSPDICLFHRLWFLCVSLLYCSVRMIVSYSSSCRWSTCYYHRRGRHGRTVTPSPLEKAINDEKLLKTCMVATVTKWIKSCLLQCFGTFKMPILMFISILVFRPEGQIWNPVRRDTRIYVRRILNAFRISKTQLISCMISPS